MSIKKVLLKAVRSPKHKADIQKMSEAEVAEFLRSLNLSDKKEEK